MTEQVIYVKISFCWSRNIMKKVHNNKQVYPVQKKRKQNKKEKDQTTICIY